MKTLLTIFTLVFTVMFSSTSFGGWTQVGYSPSSQGVVTFYIDFETIRKHGGYVYWWDLLDRLKPTKQGFLSSKGYYQGDCKLFRFKILSDSYHTKPMGAGTASILSNVPDKNWHYPAPTSMHEGMLKAVCSQ